MSRTIEYKGKIFIQYFVDLPLVSITSTIRLGILSTSFWSWTDGIFSISLRLRFWVQNLLSIVDLLQKCLQQSIPINFLLDRGVESTLDSLIFCSSKYFFVIDTLWLTGLSCWKIHSSSQRRWGINYLASLHNLLLFVDHWQIVV